MSPRCVLFEVTTPRHDWYRPNLTKCRFCSQRVQNDTFFTTRVENQTVPRILVFSWETFKGSNTIHFWCIPMKLCPFSSYLANLSEICFKRVLKDLQWYIWHLSSVEKSVGLKQIGLSAGPRFDSGRNPVYSNQHGYEHIHPRARVPNYCFQ